MSGRLKLVLGVVVLLTVAGCSSMNPLSSEVSYPDGYDESGISDPKLAAAQHNGTLHSSDSYTMELTFDGLPNSTAVEIGTQVNVESERALTSVGLHRDDSQIIGFDEYQHGSTVYRKTSLGIFGTTYNRSEREFSRSGANGTNTSSIEEWLSAVTVSSSSTRKTNGTTYRVYNISGFSDSSALVSQNFTAGVTDTTFENGTMVVSPDGLITSLELVFSYDGGAERAMFSYEISKVGDTTVDPPEWLADAKSATSE